MNSAASLLCFLFIQLAVIHPLRTAGREKGLESASPFSTGSNQNRQFMVGRESLNRPISPFSVYIQLFTVGANFDRVVKCVIFRGHPITLKTLEEPDELSRQLIPYSYTWCVNGQAGNVQRRWLASFIKNRDGTYQTVVTLPQEEFIRSRLEIFFQDIDGDGERENVTFIVDMSQFDWSLSARFITQGAEK